MIIRIKALIRTLGLLGLALIFAQPASAVPVDIVFVGTWDSTGSGNTAAGSPGLATGQRYVIRITYDDTSTVTTGVDVLNSFFTPSGDTMQTMDLTDAIPATLALLEPDDLWPSWRMVDAMEKTGSMSAEGPATERNIPEMPYQVLIALK